MSTTTHELEMAVWAVAEGRASTNETARVDADPVTSRRVIAGLVAALEQDLESVRGLTGPERDVVVADFEEDRAKLRAALGRLNGSAAPSRALAAEAPGPVQLQGSWNDGRIVVWAAGRGTAPASNDELAALLEAIGGPALGWDLHPDVELPPAHRAHALQIPLKDALGWLVAVAGGLDGTIDEDDDGGDDDDDDDRGGIGASVAWLAHVATVGVRLVAHGAVVPALRRRRRTAGPAEFAVEWRPALLEIEELDRLAAAMPGTVVAVVPEKPRAATIAVLDSVVDAIVSQAASMVELPAPPPRVSNSTDVTEAVSARLDGSPFRAPADRATEISERLDRWARPVTRLGRPKLVVQLDPPDGGDAWLLSVYGPGTNGRLLPIEEAMGDTHEPRLLMDELGRLEQVYAPLQRPGQLRRGRVVLNQAEAWELMITGAGLEPAGFGVRVPALSRRKPTPALRMFAERTAGTDSAVGVNQLSDVRWSVLFDDVELSAADISRLAKEARPLVKSRGRWVELDSIDLKEAAAALAERADTTRLSGADILRLGVGLDSPSLAGGVRIDGSGWASDLLRTAKDAPTEPITRPGGFVGELRSYQAQALAWLGFLEATGLGGCLALDMGLGKTPTILAHLALLAGTDDNPAVDRAPALVIAPPAVVGNWAAEASRFTPTLGVVIHHGASRATPGEFEAEIGDADIVITTYGTAVRDVETLSERTWGHLVLDEAQAIKNPASETAQQLRRISARTRLALTGTPVENGLGDLWSILDFTNPGLVGPRAAFVAQMAGEGEAALRALNGILVFRRTKSEPEVAAELPDRIDELDHCTMTAEQIGLYQAVIDQLVAKAEDPEAERRKGAILAAITALKQICNHPAAYTGNDDGRPLAARSGKLARLEEIVGAVFAAGEKILVFTHFAEWGRRLATHLTDVTGKPISCYDGSLARGARDRMVADFQAREGPAALVLSLKAGGTGLNLTAASHVVLYDRWWNPAVEDQARDRAWRIGQTRTVVSHRLVCPGTIDERVEEVVAGKRHIANLVLPKSSSLADLGTDQLRSALGIDADALLTEED
ncbi:MAG: DEAD/DEAH box helicase [Actinomycetota bacterium]|nr:DEAD/DEAH box helicase [Actinomycetota bacterium]